MPTYIPKYIHYKPYKPYKPLQTSQTDIQTDAYKQTPTYIQTYIPTFLQTYKTKFLYLYTTLPYKSNPTLHLNTTNTGAMKIQNKTRLYLKMKPP